jgi:WD40 repeat protein
VQISEPFRPAGGPVTALAATTLPDGRTIAAVAAGRQTLVWEPLTGAPVASADSGAKGTAVAVAVLPDGRAVMVTGAADGVVRVHDLTTGELAGPSSAGHAGGVRSVVAGSSADGRAIAVTLAGNGTLRAWELDTGTPLANPLAIPGAVTDIALVPAARGLGVVVVGGGAACLELLPSR